MSKPTFRLTASVICVGAAVWALPLAVALYQDLSFLAEVGIFFSKLAVVSFGGAYAVLAYMTQTVVTDFGWLSTSEMLDALGLAETTPGPLILVTQFVGMLVGLAQGGVSTALLAGIMVLWVTFTPCFIWIFAGAPLIDWITTQPRLQAALHSVTAAVVGVMANLSLWFALHVFFEDLQSIAGFDALLVPVFTSIQVFAVFLATMAAVLLILFRRPLLQVLLITASVALLWGLL